MDEEIWKRLDELELEEELEAHLEMEEKKRERKMEEEERQDSEEDDSSDDLSESPGLSDEDEEEEEIEVPRVKPPPPMKRKVSFGDVKEIRKDRVEEEPTEPEPICSIEISHSDQCHEVSDAPSLANMDPSHLDVLLEQRRGDLSRRPKRSILKPFDSTEINVVDLETDTAEEERHFPAVREPFVNPIKDRVVEREKVEKAKFDPPEQKKRVSKFKQSRAS